jgi:hypothetical protein
MNFLSIQRFQAAEEESESSTPKARNLLKESLNHTSRKSYDSEEEEQEWDDGKGQGNGAFED